MGEESKRNISINYTYIYIYSRHFYARGSWTVGKEESCRKEVNRGKLITSGLFWFARNSVARLDPRSRRSRRDRDLRSVIMAVINHLVKLHRKLAWWENYSSVYKRIFSSPGCTKQFPCLVYILSRDCTKPRKIAPSRLIDSIYLRIR